MALGIDEWNLRGISYGSALAIETIRNHPDGLRSVLLDSVVPPDRAGGAEDRAQGAVRAFEALYDWILKIPFRESMNWRLLAPYVALYIASSYGFVVMVWKESVAGGLLMLGLTVVQLVANALTHRRRDSGR